MNPNVGRNNRVPTAAELVSLREVSAAKARYISTLENEISEADTSFHRFNNLCDTLETQLAVARMQRDEAKTTFTSLTAQKKSLIAGMADDMVLLSAHRRFPPEILSEIFETSVALAWNPTRQAIKLSHVSKRWRNITIGNPRLWSRIVAPSMAGLAGVQDFWETFASRSGHSNVTVCVVMKELYPWVWRLCQLTKIHSLDTLEFSFPHPVVFERWISTIHNYPLDHLGKPKRLNLVFEQPLARIENWSYSKWDAGQLLALIPTVIELRTDIPFIFSRVSNAGSKLKQVTLDSRGPQARASLLWLSTLENLTELTLRNNTLRVPVDFVALPRLKTLTILRMYPLPRYSWMDKVRCPRLDKFTFYDKFDQDIGDEHIGRFIQAHPSLKKLDAYLSPDSWESVSFTNPRLTHYTLNAKWHGFSRQNANNTSVLPFPALETLVMFKSDTISREEFEEIVTARCLPLDYAGSRLPGDIQPIKKLKMRIGTSSIDDLSLEPWTSSPLYVLASKVLDSGLRWDMYYDISLSWVE